MKAVLGNGDEDGIGIRVHDNNGVSHGIHVAFDGTITYHEQDGYPDKSDERTAEENEHVSQARRYAKHYVYRNRNYPTLPVGENPDRIEAVRQVLDALDTEEWMAQFGDFYRQFESHYDPETEPVINQPLDVGVDLTRLAGIATLLADHTPKTLREMLGFQSEANLFYRQNIYLAVDESAVADLIRTEPVDPPSEPTATDTEFWSRVSRADGQQGISLAELFEIDTVGPIHAVVHDQDGESTTDHEEPRDRQPDACLQHTPVPPRDPERFRNCLDVHLRCQIRDCYLMMGCHPPDWTRITGGGLTEGLYRYEQVALYQPYHDPNADIDWEAETMTTPSI